MPDRMTLFVGNDDDNDHVIIQLNTNDQPAGYIMLDVSGAMDHLKAVIEARARLKDGVPEELEPGGGLIEATLAPKWRANGVSAPFPGVLLTLRHPGLGWNGFCFPQNEARALGQLLLDLCDRLQSNTQGS